MKNYIGAVRTVWHAWETQDPLDYHSKHYTLTLTMPNFAPQPSGLPRIPIAMSAISPDMLRVADDTADGVHLHPFGTKRYLAEESLKYIGDGPALSGRTRNDIEVVAGAFLATGKDEEAVTKKREYIRSQI